MNENILVPLDGSEHAFKALDLACDLAQKYGSKLWLLYVMGHHDVPEGLRQWAKAEHVDESPHFLWETSVAENILQAGALRASKHGVKAVEKLSADGDPARRIVETAKSKKVDLIVMGTRGLGNLQGLVLGSVAHKVTHAAEGTVVTVK